MHVCFIKGDIDLNSRFKEILIVYGMALIITILSAIFFTINGYPLVRTATETLDTIAPPLYMIPIFIPLGILFGELLFLLLSKYPYKWTYFNSNFLSFV
jgi:type IV secretory pathway VirB6-like protein